jgi:hypothetical protein
VKLARYDGTQSSFSRAATHTDGIYWEVIKAADTDESVLELTVALDGGMISPGQFRSVLDVFTASHSTPELRIPIRASVREDLCGVVASIVVAGLKRGVSEDRLLVTGEHETGGIEAVVFEGVGPISVELVAVDADLRKSSIPAVRICRNDGPQDGPVCRGKLAVTVAGRVRPIRIPLTVFFVD